MKQLKRHATFGNLVLAAVFLAGAGFFADGLWIKGKAVLAQAMLNHAFVSSSQEPKKPWPWADITPMARIEAPRLKTSQIVLDGTSGEALAFGPGHLPGTAKPGERGTAVFAAHRDTHFRWLGDLRPGDVVRVERPDGTEFAYEVRRAWVARYDAPGINPDGEEALIALTTCWPLDARQMGPMRYIVEGVLKVPPPEASNRTELPTI